MKYKIIGDSCTEFTEHDIKKEYVDMASLIVNIDGEEIVDAIDLSQDILLEKMDVMKNPVRTACPSPDVYMQLYEGAENVFVVTLSQKLSGSYSSAEVAARMFMEDNEGVKIHVFDSKSASSGQYAIYKKIEELCKEELSFEDIVEKVEKFINELYTIFVFENLDNLIKNGRISKLKGTVAGMLNIKPVLIGLDGEIHELDRGRGMNKALNVMLRHIEKNYNERAEKPKHAYISECDAVNRALNLRKIMIERFGFEEVSIIKTRGLATSYAGHGGIVVAF